jgi:hypothetical protein
VLKQDDSPRTDIVAEAKTGILEVRGTLKDAARLADEKRAT